MFCENCKEKHDGTYGSGRFCCQFCARSFVSNKNKGTKIVRCITCRKNIEVDKRASDKLCKCDNCKKTSRKSSRPRIECSKCGKIIYKNKKGLCKKCYDESIRRVCNNCGRKINKNKSGLCRECFNKNSYEMNVKDWINSGNIELKGRPRGFVRKFILEKQNYKCKICEIEQNWNNKKLVFVLDHINGKSWDNSPENLRLVCPNCDSQLPTFKSKNKGNGRKYDRNYRSDRYNGRVDRGE